VWKRQSVPPLPLVVLSLGSPAALYLAARAPDRWGLEAGSAQRTQGGAYRAAHVVAWAPRDVPWVVGAAAFTSLLLGQVLVPGVFAAILAAAALVARARAGEPVALLGVLVVTAPTGLIAAGWQLAAGFALLRRSSAVPRRAACWTIGHHALFLAALGVAAAAGDAGRTACAALSLVSLASIGQAALLLRAALAVGTRG
jgi:hypothetical protein